ncbi:orotate phosphoribosyltransferase [Candidatus Poribacteria bacterium]|nr:orotate phosphoribosyltransferase [Candidatus Poribacteria bacterium]
MALASADIASALRAANVLKHGIFTLRSGAKSPIYVDLRHVPSVPASIDTLTDALAERIRQVGAYIVAGAETAGIPLAAIIAHKLRLPMVYVRKEPKAHGTGSQVEGVLEPGARVALVDDLITQGTSKFVFLDALKAASVRCEDVVVILDREQGGTSALAARGATLHALITLRQLLDEYTAMGALSRDQHTEIRAYLDDPTGWEASLRV